MRKLWIPFSSRRKAQIYPLMAAPGPCGSFRVGSPVQFPLPPSELLVRGPVADGLRITTRRPVALALHSLHELGSLRALQLLLQPHVAVGPQQLAVVHAEHREVFHAIHQEAQAVPLLKRLHRAVCRWPGLLGVSDARASAITGPAEAVLQDIRPVLPIA